MRRPYSLLLLILINAKYNLNNMKFFKIHLFFNALLICFLSFVDILKKHDIKKTLWNNTAFLHLRTSYALAN